MLKRVKKPKISPEAQKNNELIKAHLERVKEAVNKEEVPVPALMKVQIMTQYALDFMNKRVQGVRTVDKNVQEHIKFAIDALKKHFVEEGLPKPQSIIDSWSDGKFSLKVNFKKADEKVMMAEYLGALPAADTDTQQAIDDAIGKFEKGKK